MHDQDELTRCLAEIARLRAENVDLRHASESFGRLAERLNRELRLERIVRRLDRGYATPPSQMRIHGAPGLRFSMLERRSRPR